MIAHAGRNVFPPSIRHMSPRSRKVVESLLRSAKPTGGELLSVELEPAELRGIAPTFVSEDVLARVVSPHDLRTGDAGVEGVDLFRSGDEVVIDVPLYRERDRWELPMTPEAYERLLEHVVTVHADEADREGASVGERVRYYRPDFSSTDVKLTVGVLVEIARTPDLATAYLIGLKTAAKLHADALRLALAEEGARIVREARPDPAIPAASYLELQPDELTRRRVAFESAIAHEPRKLRGVFDHGMVKIELTLVSDGHYHIQVMSIPARAGNISANRPVLAVEVPHWCQNVGAPVDAFEWEAED